MASVAEQFAEPESHVETRDEKQYRKMLEDYLGPATFLFGLFLAVAVLHLPFGFDGESPAEHVADHLAMDPKEQELIIPPLARILDKQHFGGEVKRHIMASGDYVGLVMGLGTYLLRTVAVMGQLRGEMVYVQSGGAPAEQAAHQNGYQPVQRVGNPSPSRVNVGGLYGG